MKKHLVTFLKFAVSFAIIGYLCYQAWQNDQFAMLVNTPKQWWRLSLALVVTFVAVCVSYVRWYMLVRALSIPFGLLDAFRLGFIGMLFSLFTFGVLGGDAVKAMFVAREAPDHKAEAILTVFIDRFFGLFSLFMIAGAAYFVVSAPEGVTPGQWKAIQVSCLFSIAFAVCGLAGMAVLMVAPNLDHSKLFKLMYRIPKVGPLFRRGVQSLMVYRTRPLTILMTIGMSLMVHSLLITAFYLVASGLSEDCPPLTKHFVFVPIAEVAGALPLPGGLGGLEAALDFLYVAFGSGKISSGFGLFVAFAYRILTMLIAMIGVVLYLSHRKQVRELMDAAEEELAAVEQAAAEEAQADLE